MSEWIPFHRELTIGRKRALSRATRFIFLELALHARAKRGEVELPGSDLVDAVHDLIGGSRREIAKAIPALVAEGMIVIDLSHGSVRIPSWSKWNFRDPAGTVRQARFRENQREHEGNSAPPRPPTNPPRNAPRNAEPLPRGEDSRREERKGPRQDPPGARARVAPTVPSPAGGALDEAEKRTLEEADAAARARLNGPTPGPQRLQPRLPIENVSEGGGSKS